MRQGKSSTRANRIKKQQRMESKKDLRSYYIKVARVPEDKLPVSTHVTDRDTADKLINGTPTIMNGLIISRKKLSRNFREVA